MVFSISLREIKFFYAKIALTGGSGAEAVKLTTQVSGKKKLFARQKVKSPKIKERKEDRLKIEQMIFRRKKKENKNCETSCEKLPGLNDSVRNKM